MKKKSNSKPPVPSKELNPLQGMPILKIDYYGLGGVVRKLVNAGNKVPAIHKELNENHLTPEAPRISLMGVHRWIRKNMNEEYRDGRIAEDYAINTYNEECQMLKTVNDQITMLEILSDEITTSISVGFDVKDAIRNAKEVAFSLEKMLARKQALLVSVKQTQEKIFTYAHFQEVIGITLEKVKEKDMVLHAEIISELKNNTFLQEFYKKLAPKQ